MSTIMIIDDDEACLKRRMLRESECQKIIMLRSEAQDKVLVYNDKDIEVVFKGENFISKAV